ncbi:hypothetical protein [Streptomyces sp. NPDC017993]|uniref:hypothetical protein n=1 Tax=Streptomyces sp. NPDC017993 TaxID=3365027 RepID=UPI00378B78B8
MTMPQCGPLANAPLEQLFPVADEGDLELVRQGAAKVDVALAPGPPALWEWEPGVLCTVVTVSEGVDSRLEFLLQVDCSEGVTPSVFASACVTCGCERNHETHFIEEEPIYLAGASHSLQGLGPAFGLAADLLVEFLANPKDAAHWRSLRGLPAPRSAIPEHP